VLGVREYQVAEVTPGLDFVEQTMRAGRASVAAPGAMIRREALGAIRFAEEGPIGFGDFVVWFQIAERWAVGHIARRLWGWTLEPNAQSVRRIVSLIRDYDVNLNAYCDGYESRRPDDRGRVALWRRLIRRYIFWALAFEVGLHYRHLRGGNGAPATLFEMLPYQLTAEEYRLALDRLDDYCTGADQQLALATLKSLLRVRCTWPLAWATRHYSSMRVLLGLR